MELVFESKYGKIIDYSLFGDGYIVLGFSEGKIFKIRLRCAYFYSYERTLK